MQQPMWPSYEDDYRRLVEFYFEVKGLVAAAEKEEAEQRISISAIAELRSAYDHVMRVHAFQYGLTEEAKVKEDSGLNAEDYCKINLNKAYAHLYRAGYDAYDCIVIALVDEVKHMLAGVARTTLHTVIPDAASEIVRPYDRAKKLSVEAKVQKDVESREQEKRQFQSYQQACNDMYDVKEKLLDRMNELVAVDTEARQRRRKYILITIIVGVASAVAAAAVTIACYVLST